MMLPGRTALIGDLLGRQFHCSGPQEPQLRGFACPVMRPAGVAGDGTGDRRRDDHPAVAAGGQCRKRGLNDEHRPLEVDGQHLIDVLGRQFFELARREDTGVGADDVQAAVLLNGGFDSAATVLWIRHIGPQAAHPPGLRRRGRPPWRRAPAWLRAVTNTLTPRRRTWWRFRGRCPCCRR